MVNVNGELDGYSEGELELLIDNAFEDISLDGCDGELDDVSIGVTNGDTDGISDGGNDGKYVGVCDGVFIDGVAGVIDGKNVTAWSKPDPIINQVSSIPLFRQFNILNTTLTSIA